MFGISGFLVCVFVLFCFSFIDWVFFMFLPLTVPVKKKNKKIRKHINNSEHVFYVNCFTVTILSL